MICLGSTSWLDPAQMKTFTVTGAPEAAAEAVDEPPEAVAAGCAADPPQAVASRVSASRTPATLDRISVIGPCLLRGSPVGRAEPAAEIGGRLDDGLRHPPAVLAVEATARPAAAQGRNGRARMVPDGGRHAAGARHGLAVVDGVPAVADGGQLADERGRVGAGPLRHRGHPALLEKPGHLRVRPGGHQGLADSRGMDRGPPDPDEGVARGAAWL